ncbi:hypothetical protein E4U54_007073, partial [Claviceps lovelessii]
MTSPDALVQTCAPSWTPTSTFRHHSRVPWALGPRNNNPILNPGHWADASQGCGV